MTFRLCEIYDISYKMTLKDKAVKATTWSGADMLLRLGLQFGFGIVLARLLTPGEFGTIALLYLFVGLASAFIDSGFSSALIQQQDITNVDESTVFWFNLAMGGLMAFGLWSAASWIASFFDRPILTPLTKLLALNLFVSALGSIHSTLLTKRLDFKIQMKISAIATLVSGMIGVGMAWKGFGVWALAVQTLTATSMTTTLLWVMSPWRPARQISIQSARRFYGFGSYLFLSGLLDIIYNRIYTILIGKCFGVSELGFYNRAESTKQLPVSLLTGVLSRVTFPIFSAAANDKEQLRRGMRLALRSIMLINVPMMLGLMAMADHVIPTVFGAQWLPAVTIVQVLCLAGILWPLHVINLNVLMAQGHSRLFLRLEIAKKIIGSLLIVCGSYYGVLGLAWSQVAFAVVAFLINVHYSKIYLDYGATQQTLDFLPALLVAGLMAGVVYWLGRFAEWPVPFVLVAQIVVGLGVYLAGCKVFRVQALNETWSLVAERWPILRVAKVG